MTTGPTIFLAEITAWTPAGATTVLRYSNTVYTTGASDTPASTYYDARISQAVDVSRSMFTGGNTQGGSRIGAGDLTLMNGDGALDALMRYGFDGRALTVWRSTTLDPSYPADFTKIFVGTMQQPEFTQDTIRLKTRDLLYGLTLPLQTTKYAGTNVGAAGLEGVAGDLQGKPKPVCLGAPTNVPAPCVNTSSLTYQVNGGAVADIPAVYDRGSLITKGADYATSALMLAAAPGAGTYITCFAEGYFRLGSAPVGLVTADVTQGAAAADRTAAQLYLQMITRANIANPNVIALGLLTRVTTTGLTRVTTTGATRIVYSIVSSADITALDAANSAVLGFWTMTETRLIDVCDQIANSVGAWWGVDVNGTFRIKQFTIPQGTAVLTITANDLLKPLNRISTTDPGQGLPAFRCTVRWGQSYAVQPTDVAGGVTDARRAVIAQQWRSAVSTDSTVQVSNLLSSETLEDSLLTTLVDAQAEADRRLAIRKIQRDRYEVVIPLNSETQGTDIGDVIELVHPRFGLGVVGDSVGTLASGSLFRVLDVTPNAKAAELRLNVWGRSMSQNRATVDGAYRVTSTGAFRVISVAA
jgi:hypothetical protein